MSYRNSNANSVDPNQTPQNPHFVASDLGLHGLPMSLLWDARHVYVYLFGHYYTNQLFQNN